MNELTIKVLKLAAQICWMHGSVAGRRVSQEWSGDNDVLDTLTEDDRRLLAYQYQQMNSNGADFDPERLAFDDEMLVSFYVAHSLDLLLAETAVTQQEEPPQ
jgi:hypothetical protein